MFSKQGLMFISADKFCPHANRSYRPELVTNDGCISAGVALKR